MNQENVTNVNEEVISESMEDKAVVDWGFDEDKAEEITKEINDAINKEIQDSENLLRTALKKAFGVNEKIYEIKESFAEFFTDVIELIENGNEEQRREGLTIIETIERLGIVRAGVSLGVKDALVTFDKNRYEKKRTSNKKLRRDKAFTVGMPKAGLTKEEFDKEIEQQILSQYENAPQEVIEGTIASTWAVYEKVSEEDKSE